jgi:hypothetical protein
MQDDEAFRREADQLVRLYGELGRRLANRGIRGIDELVALHQQVRAAVDTIAGQEIDTALLQIATLLDRLRLLSRCLGTLSEMKLCLGATSEGDESTSLAGLLTVAGARPPIDSTGGH